MRRKELDHILTHILDEFPRISDLTSLQETYSGGKSRTALPVYAEYRQEYSRRNV